MNKNFKFWIFWIWILFYKYPHNILMIIKVTNLIYLLILQFCSLVNKYSMLLFKKNKNVLTPKTTNHCSQYSYFLLPIIYIFMFRTHEKINSQYTHSLAQNAK
jgi:hypothetical protein